MSGIILTVSARMPRALARGRWLVLVRPVICGIALSQLFGCVSSGEIIPLEIRQGRPMLKKTVPEAERLKVAVIPFEDQRPDTSRIGTRRDWLGSKTPLTIKGGNLGDILAEVFVDYLRNRHGWHTWVAKPGVVPPDGGPDITFSGTVVAFGADAAPGLGGTDLTVTAQIHMKAQHAVVQQSAVVRLEDVETQWVFWFEPRELETLVSSALRKNMEKFMSQVEVDRRSLRLK